MYIPRGNNSEKTRLYQQKYFAENGQLLTETDDNRHGFQKNCPYLSVLSPFKSVRFPPGHPSDPLRSIGAVQSSLDVFYNRYNSRLFQFRLSILSDFLLNSVTNRLRTGFFQKKSAKTCKKAHFFTNPLEKTKINDIVYDVTRGSSSVG